MLSAVCSLPSTWKQGVTQPWCRLVPVLPMSLLCPGSHVGASRPISKDVSKCNLGSEAIQLQSWRCAALSP